jgi:hypothetical protein
MTTNRPSPAALAALARKYRVMSELRASLPPHGAAAPPSAAARAALRALAAEFPGALRELDTLSTETLAARGAALEAAAAGGPDAPWMSWMAGYHALMRTALSAKGRGTLDDAARDALIAASEWPIDRAFLDAALRPSRGRLNVVVFDQLARTFGTPAGVLWDALFPRRGAAPRGYR